jgi:tryptophanyl-tRNA synthetase
MPGLDGRKMSKSYDNAIYIADTAEVTAQKIKTMFTDPLRQFRKDPGHPDECPVFGLHGVYNSSETEEIAAECKSAGIGCVDCKKKLTEKLNCRLEPIRERRRQLEEDDSELQDILAAGADKARAFAQQTMADVRRAMHLD